jgi:hypothetical protein
MVDLKAAIGLFFFWLVMASLYGFVIVPMGGGTFTGNALNATVDPSSVTGEGADIWAILWNIVPHTISVIMFVNFGIGLPGDTPLWFVIMFAVIITLVNFILLIVLINSFWSGGKG